MWKLYDARKQFIHTFKSLTGATRSKGEASCVKQWQRIRSVFQNKTPWADYCFVLTKQRQARRMEVCTRQQCFSHLSHGAKIKMGKEDDAMVKYFLKNQERLTSALDHAHFAQDVVLFVNK